jgi:serine O-acetyltransferase
MADHHTEAPEAGVTAVPGAPVSEDRQRDEEVAPRGVRAPVAPPSPPMSRTELKFLIWSDLERYRGAPTVTKLLRELIVGIGFKYLFFLRLNHYLDSRSRIWLPIQLMGRLLLRRYSLKFGIDISRFASVGPGLKIEHFGGVFVNRAARIGKHCTLCQDVTLGGYRGAPHLTAFVFVGPGAKLLNGIQIGTNVIIGANCVVTQDMPDNAVVVGIPAKVVSSAGNLRGDRRAIMAEKIRWYQQICPRACWRKYGLDT